MYPHRAVSLSVSTTNVDLNKKKGNPETWKPRNTENTEKHEKKEKKEKYENNKKKTRKTPMGKQRNTMKKRGKTRKNKRERNNQKKMKYYDCVIQYAVDRFLEPLRSVRQGLKACCVCTLSLSTTSVDFSTPPLTWFAPLMQDS